MIVIVLMFAVLVLAALVFIFFRKAQQLEQALDELEFRKRSQSVKYGKITEQFIPFLNNLPFSPENFRFLGSPIDGVAFSEDSIIFCEFKSSDSRLSSLQQKIKDLVERKRVEWLEFRLR